MSDEITKERDTENRSSYENKSLEVNPLQGLDGTKMLEQGIIYDGKPTEKVISNVTNAHIVLGKSQESMFRGSNRSGQIQLIAGLGATNHFLKLKKFIPTIATSSQDAATVLISQRTNIDKEWQISDGFVGKSGSRSAVGMKADNIRIVAREGIKISTLNPGVEPNSLFGKIKTSRGIDLLAGISDGTFKEGGKRYNYLQPIVKGDNLEAFLESLIKEVQLLSSDLKTFYDIQKKFNNALANHTHVTPAGPDSPSASLLSKAPVTNLKINKRKDKMEKFKKNLDHFKETYLGKKETSIKSKSVRST